MVEEKKAEEPAAALKREIKGNKDSTHKINVRSDKKRDSETFEPKVTKNAKVPERNPVNKDPLQGYTPPFKNKDKSAAEKAASEAKPKKVYTLEFIFQFKHANK